MTVPGNTIERCPRSGRWTLYSPTRVELFTHQSRGAVEAHAAELAKPPAPAPVDPNALLNDTIAHIANIWGPYEMPRFGLTERVRHIPTGLVCVVKGYMGWSPPILLYSLETEDGRQLEHLTPLSDMAHIDPLEDTVVLTRE